MEPSITTRRSRSDLAARTRQPTQVRCGAARPRLMSLPRRRVCGTCRMLPFGGRSGLRVGPDVDPPAGEPGGETGVLPFFSDRQGELVVGYNDPRDPPLGVDDLNVVNPRRRQGIPDELGGLVGPVDDVDLLAVQLVHHISDTAAHRPDA